MVCRQIVDIAAGVDFSVIVTEEGRTLSFGHPEFPTTASVRARSAARPAAHVAARDRRAMRGGAGGVFSRAARHQELGPLHGGGCNVGGGVGARAALHVGADQEGRRVAGPGSSSAPSTAPPSVLTSRRRAMRRCRRRAGSWYVLAGGERVAGWGGLCGGLGIAT